MLDFHKFILEQDRLALELDIFNRVEFILIQYLLHGILFFEENEAKAFVASFFI